MVLSIKYVNGTNTLQVAFHQQLTADDVVVLLLPSMDKVLSQFSTVNLLLEFCHDFAGWQLSAIWDEIKYNFSHRKQISRIAVVGSPQVAEWFLNVIFPVAPGGIENFTLGEIEKARAWLAY